MIPAPPKKAGWDSPATLVVLLAVTVIASAAAIHLDRRRFAATPRPATAVAPASTQPAPPAPSPEGETDGPVFLSDLEPSRVIAEPAGGLGRDRAPWGGEIARDGVVEPKGLVMAPGPRGAIVEYGLDRRFRYLMADAALIDPACYRKGSARLRVLVDGQERFRSRTLVHGQHQEVFVSLSGADRLRLEVDDAGDGPECDRACWIGARLVPNFRPIAK